MPLPVPTPYLPVPMYLTIEEARASMVDSGFGDEAAGSIDFSVAGPFNNQQLKNMIVQASRRIDAHCLDTMMLTTRFEEQRGQGGSNIRLWHYPIWQGLITTLTADAHQGDMSIQLADTTGIQPGKILFLGVTFGQGQVIEFSVPTTQVSGNYVLNPYGGPGTVPLVLPLGSGFPSGTTAQVSGVDFLQIVLPGSTYPISAQAIVTQYATGIIENYSPLIFQSVGYTPNFARDVPLQIQYTSGYLPSQYPPTLKQACLDVMTYQVVQRRMTGVVRAHRGETTVQYGQVGGKNGALPAEICYGLTQFCRYGGIWG